MKAMVLDRQSPIEEMPLKAADLPIPTPNDDQVLVKVSVCGACHTDLDEAEGRLEPSKSPIVPGHQVVRALVIDHHRYLVGVLLFNRVPPEMRLTAVVIVALFAGKPLSVLVHDNHAVSRGLPDIVRSALR